MPRNKHKKRTVKIPKTEVEVLREKLRRENVMAVKPFRSRKWMLVRMVGGSAGPRPIVGMELAWERVNGHLGMVNPVVAKFPSETIALRNAVINPETYIWRR